MSDYVKAGNFQVAPVLYEFINSEALPGSGIDSKQFWDGFGTLVEELAPRNKELLIHRVELQDKINKWHQDNRSFDFDKYKSFLEEIRYMEPPVEKFQVNNCQYR
jgi:malate synthase